MLHASTARDRPSRVPALGTGIPVIGLERSLAWLTAHRRLARDYELPRDRGNSCYPELAGLRDGRLHDARHTAATVLLILGTAERAVMGLMGWSDSGMAKRYQHMTATVCDDIARRVGGLLWDTPDDDTPDDGAAGVLAKVS